MQILQYAILFQYSICQVFSHIEDVKILSELPLEKLLFLRKSLQSSAEKSSNDDSEEKQPAILKPHALALQQVLF